MEGNEMTKMKIDDLLYKVSFKVHEGHQHIKVIDNAVCKKCKYKQCSFCCPANCYTIDAEGKATVNTDGCLECGTCRIVCDEFNNIEWNYPASGFGVKYKNG